VYVAVRDVTLFQGGYPSVLQGLKDLGLTAVELAVGRNVSVLHLTSSFAGPRAILTDREGMTDLRAEYAEAGIHISGLMVASNFNAEDLESEIAWVVGAVHLADALGADAVRVDAAMTGQRELSFPRRVSLYAVAVRRILEATPEAATPLAIENHGLQGSDPRWLREVLDALGSPRVGVALDTANFYWAGLSLASVYHAIEEFAPSVKHVHCKNLCLEPERREVQRERGWGYGDYACPIPDGDVDHARVAKLLCDAGYEGGLNIEDESLGKFTEEERPRQLRRDVEHLTAIVEGLSPDCA
jgi:sugar phosphate isomerase/epimerase